MQIVVVLYGIGNDKKNKVCMCLIQTQYFFLSDLWLVESTDTKLVNTVNCSYIYRERGKI